MRGLLIFYDYFTPAYKAGGPIRSLENLIQLINGVFHTYVITSNQDHDGEYLAVTSDEWIKRTEAISIIYLSKGNRGIDKLEQIISEISFDCVYINGIFSPFTTVNPLRLARRFNVPVMIAPRGMFQEGALSIKPLKKKLYLYLLKAFLLRGNQVSWHATDEQEAKDILKVVGNKASVMVLGNIPSFNSMFEQSEKPLDRIKLVTISLVAPKKNHGFFLNILKEVKTDQLIEYDIYGPVRDEQYFITLQDIVKKLPANIKVSFLPPVLPREVNKVLANYHYFILPTLGENFGHAIFEAFNMGLPVLISDQTPWKYLEKKRAGWDLPLNEKAWLCTMDQLLSSNEEKYKSFQRGARKVAVDYMEQVDLKREYVEMFEEVCSR